MIFNVTSAIKVSWLNPYNFVLPHQKEMLHPSETKTVRQKKLSLIHNLVLLYECNPDCTMSIQEECMNQ